MAKTLCVCGNILSNVEAPNDVELNVYTGRQWAEIAKMGMIDSLDIPGPTYDVWRCPECERVMVFDIRNDRTVNFYALESPPTKLPGMRCGCGHVHAINEPSSDWRLIVYTDIEWENEINVGEIGVPNINTADIRPPSHDVWRCPECGRISVYEPGQDVPVKVYVIEEG